jgi:hypothetical protein
MRVSVIKGELDSGAPTRMASYRIASLRENDYKFNQVLGGPFSCAATRASYRVSADW